MEATLRVDCASGEQTVVGLTPDERVVLARAQREARGLALAGGEVAADAVRQRVEALDVLGAYVAAHPEDTHIGAIARLLSSR